MHRHQRRRRRSGATLVELLVALLLFNLALLGAVSVSALAVRRIGEAGRVSRATLAATRRVEWLASGNCLTGVSGGATIETGMLETWSASPFRGTLDIVDSVVIESRATRAVVLRARAAC